MDRYAASVIVRGPAPVHVGWRHTCVVFEAFNEDEAIGKAMRFALRVYPISRGFRQHDVSVCSVENVVDVDTASPNGIIPVGRF